MISHLLSRIAHKDLKREKIKLPRRRIGRYKAVDYPFKFVKERF